MSKQVIEVLSRMVDCRQTQAQEQQKHDALCEALHELIDGEKVSGNVFTFGDYVVQIDRSFSAPKYRYKVSLAVALPVVLTLEAPKPEPEPVAVD